MIALCPACHDAAHHGSLKITEQILYGWKSADRTQEYQQAVLSVEPAQKLGLVAGSIIVETAHEHAIVFELSNANTLAFRIEDDDILLVRSRLRNLEGREVLRISDNRIRSHRDQAVSFDSRPGRVRIEVPCTPAYIYPEMVRQMQFVEPSYGTSGRIPALDIEVLEPGLVKVRGIWASQKACVVITDERFAVLYPNLLWPLSIMDEQIIRIIWDGPITAALFNIWPASENWRA
ncbi:hypothetical protein CQ12_13795 [Bradyrhizobium jicamae]|uniref:Uncharacterized protein n=2 Tax=Bradyrhizobium jicamae TaxID=280332 RepID=A0A0R3LP93_9BRAD|nr:hypothetical protein CQ12_13795 [Bradyrhizobium jicamae]